MRLHEFLRRTNNYEELISYLCEKNVIRRTVECPRCKTILNIEYTNETLLFHCTNHYYKIVSGRKRQKKTCNFKLSALNGTFFSRFRLGLDKACRFIAYFLMLRPPRQQFLQYELEMSPNSVVDWTNFCRELLAQWSRHNILLGGPGKIIEIDEAKIGKRKYNRGRIIQGQWVFGGYERDSGRIFIIPIKDRTESTLITEIRRYILPETTIYSDCWRGYRSISQHNYIHAYVNHSENFVNPINGCHTQNIERVWRDMRGAIPRYGISERHYKHYIAEFLFKRNYPFEERIEAFFQIMADIYPINNNVVE